MKKHQIIFVFIILLLGIFFAGCSNNGFLLTDSKQKPVIGVIVGTFDDTWRTFLRNVIYTVAEDQNVQVDIWSGNNSQTTENEKMALLIDKKVNALAINPIDLATTNDVIENLKQANIPVVFFNHEPQLATLQKWDKAYYVGAKAEQSGLMQGQILIEYFRIHPIQNGVIRYVMLKGEPGNQDAELRTKYVIKALEEAGFKVQKIAEETAMWDRMKAHAVMESILTSQEGNVDCVIANNDSMALGAIDALKSRGYFQNDHYMPVVGVDATSLAIKALEDGSLLGTVLNDATAQGKAIVELANVLAQGQIPDSSNCEFTISDGKYIWVDYKKITKDNISAVK